MTEPVIRPSTRFRRSRDCVAADLPGETVIVHGTTNAYYSLNETASEVWAALEDEQSLGALAARLASVFAVDEARAEADLTVLLTRLVAEQIVEVRASSAGVEGSG